MGKVLKYYPGAIINGVELIERDEEKSKSWKYKCPTCGKIKSSRIERIGTNCSDCAKQIRKQKVAEIGRNNYRDLTGQQFGYLTVLEKTDKRENKKVVWKCQCICGNICEVLSTNLTANRTKSCGCKSKELIGKANSYLETEVKIGDIVNGSEILDFYFQKDSRNFREAWVKCTCQFCGKIYNVRYRCLKNENTQSCGCAKRSLGEKYIEQLLKEANISFEQEKTFSDCYFSSINVKSRFDFYVNNKYLIEYDGEQHYFPSGRFTEDDVQLIQERDKYKNQYCKEHNIPLIRIPYTHKNNIVLEDLLLETSKFIIKEE